MLKIEVQLGIVENGITSKYSKINCKCVFFCKLECQLLQVGQAKLRNL